MWGRVKLWIYYRLWIRFKILAYKKLFSSTLFFSFIKMLLSFKMFSMLYYLLYNKTIKLNWLINLSTWNNYKVERLLLAIFYLPLDKTSNLKKKILYYLSRWKIVIEKTNLPTQSNSQQTSHITATIFFNKNNLL
jgi:hypothetical protein